MVIWTSQISEHSLQYDYYKPCYKVSKCSRKVKWSRYRPGVAQRVGRGIALLFHDRGTRMGWVISSTPRPHFTPRKDPVPILQEAGWAPGSVGWVENLVPTGFRSRTIQPVVSRCTDWATRPTSKYSVSQNLCQLNFLSPYKRRVIVISPYPETFRTFTLSVL